MTPSTTPLSFVADPLVTSIYEGDEQFFDAVLVAGFPLWSKRTNHSDNVGQTDKGETNHGEEDDTDDAKEWEKSYQEFLSLVQSCFDGVDEDDDDNEEEGVEEEGKQQELSSSSLFLYQSPYLHVTIATLYPLVHPTRNSANDFPTIEKQKKIQDYFQTLVERASQPGQRRRRRRRRHGDHSHDDDNNNNNENNNHNNNDDDYDDDDSPRWPDRPLELQLERAQLGTHAGILLWKDVSGGISQLRTALRREQEQLRQELHQREKEQKGFETSSPSPDDESQLPAPQSEEFFPIHSIPDIVHTTFLRYTKEDPTMTKTKRTRTSEAVQKRFQERVLPQLSRLFPKPTSISKIHLVCERTPYMHFQTQNPSETMWMTLTL